MCRECHGDIKFLTTAPRGLDFKIKISCKCGNKFVHSYPLINDKAYEINRRLVFVMRLLVRKGCICFVA